MLGLTLEGGGAKGAYQIGAWKAFKEMGIEFNGITGTSIGALNGALMIQEDFEVAYDLWYNIEPTKVLNIDDRIYDVLTDDKLDSKDLSIIYQQIIKVIKGSGIDNRPMELLVKNHLKEDAIRTSLKDFGFVTVCLTDRQPLQLYKEDIPYGRMAEYLLASAWLPIFKANRFDGKNFLDGGFYNNLPVDMLYDKGYRDIIAIRLHSQGRIKRIDYKDLNIRYIQSTQNLGRMLDFTQKRARKNLQLGYLDTVKAIKNLKGREYYIIGDISEDAALRYLMSFNNETTIKLAALFGIPQYMSTNRALLEGVIPKLFQIMNLKEKSGYNDLVFLLLEKMASRKKVSSLQIYPLETFIQIIENKNQGEDKIAIEGQEKQRGEFFKSKSKLMQEVIDIIFENENHIRI